MDNLQTAEMNSTDLKTMVIHSLSQLQLLRRLALRYYPLKNQATSIDIAINNTKEQAMHNIYCICKEKTFVIQLEIKKKKRTIVLAIKKQAVET